MSLFLSFFLLLPVSELPKAPAVSPPPRASQPLPAEKFLGQLSFNGLPLAVMAPTTEALLDGKPTPYLDIPDESTELVEIHIDLKRRVILKIAYVTKRDI